MQNVLQLKTWGRGLRIAALVAAALGLSGCMAGYSYVQPGVAGAGGYYTGDTAYPAYYDGGGYAYGAPYNSLSLSIGSGWGPGYYGGGYGYYGGYGYAYPSYYRGRRGNWHGGHGNHGGHRGGQAWRPAGTGGSVEAGGYAPVPHGATRPAPSGQRSSGRRGTPPEQRR